MKRIIPTLILLMFLFMVLPGFVAQAAKKPSSNPGALLQYIDDLKKNPGDNILREKIIKLAQSTKPALDAAKELRALARTFFEKSGIEASALVDLACFLGFAMPGVSASCSEQSVDSERSVDSGTGEIETDRSNSTNSKHK